MSQKINLGAQGNLTIGDVSSDYVPHGLWSAQGSPVPRFFAVYGNPRTDGGKVFVGNSSFGMFEARDVSMSILGDEIIFFYKLRGLDGKLNLRFSRNSDLRGDFTPSTSVIDGQRQIVVPLIEGLDYIVG